MNALRSPGFRQYRNISTAIDIANIAGAKRVEWNGSLSKLRADNARVVVVKEEVQLIFDDRSANVAAKLILDQVVARNDWRRIIAEPAIGNE